MPQLGALPLAIPVPPLQLPAWVATWRRTSEALRTPANTRRRRPWLAMVGMPLATIAAVLTGQWFALLPLGFGAWWWSPPRLWNWLIAAETAWVGSAWALAGTTALATWPRQRLTVGLGWAGEAGTLFAVSAHSRRAGSNA